MMENSTEIIEPFSEALEEDLKVIQHSALLAAHMGVITPIISNRVVDDLESIVESNKTNGYGDHITNLKTDNPKVLKYNICLCTIVILGMLSVVVAVTDIFSSVIDPLYFILLTIVSCIASKYIIDYKHKYIATLLPTDVWRSEQTAYINYLIKYGLDDDTVNLTSNGKLTIDILFDKDKMYKFIDILSGYPQYHDTVIVFEQYIDALDNLGYSV